MNLNSNDPPYMPRIPREILNPSISRIIHFYLQGLPCRRQRSFIYNFLNSLSLSRCNISRQLLANISRHFNPSRAISIRYVFPPKRHGYFCLSFVTLTLIPFAEILAALWNHRGSTTIRLSSSTSVPRLDLKPKHVRICAYIRIFNNKRSARLLLKGQRKIARNG